MSEHENPLSVADVLERAADLIEPEGRWTQGVYARGKSGHPVSTKRAATCFCALGAMNVAAGGGPDEDVKPDACSRLVERVTGASFFGIASWNDAPERTQAEVVAKLREAAALARSQERRS